MKYHLFQKSFFLLVSLFLFTHLFSQAGSNLALSKPAYSSSNEGAYLASSAVDADEGTRWASLTTDNEWIYVDLQNRYALDSVVLHWEVAFGRDYDIEVSYNAQDWYIATEIRDGDGLYDKVLVTDTARYVRMKGIRRGTGFGYSLYSFKVYGHARITSPYLNSILINPANTSIKIGEEIQFKAQGFDQSGNPFKVTKKWQVSGGGIIDANGLFYAKKAGTYSVSINSNRISGTTLITVIDAPTITITPTNANIKTDSILKLTAANTLDTLMVPLWTSSEGSSIDNDGNFTSSTPGLYIVTAQLGEKSEFITVAVNNSAQVLSEFNITPNSTTINTGEEIQISIIAKDQLNANMNVSALWSVNNNAIIKANGLFKTLTAGEYSIIAEANGFKDTAIITVIEAPYVSDIVISPKIISIKQGQQYQFTATATDQFSESIVPGPTWTIAGGNIIDDNGIITAVFPGIYKVIASENNGSDTAIVYIYPTNTTNIALSKPASASTGNASLAVDGNTGSRWESASSDPQWIVIDLQDTFAIGAVIIDWETARSKEYKIQLSNNQTDWFDAFHQTNGTGLLDSIPIFMNGRYIRMYGISRSTVYGHSIWEFKVFASDSTFERNVKYISLSAETNSINIGDSVQCIAQCFDQFDLPFSTAVAYTANGGSITSKGWFKASSEGTYTITAISGTKQAKTIIKARTNPVLTQIKVSPELPLIYKNVSCQFVAGGFDQYGDAIAINETWSAPLGGTINVNGIFNAALTGNYSVVASYSGLNDTVLFSVTEMPIVTSISVNPASAELNTGDTLQFTANALDQFGDPISSTINWIVTGGGTISNKGLFIAKLGGSYTLTVSSGIVSKDIPIIIHEDTVPVGIILTPNIVNMKSYDDFQFEYYALNKFGNHLPITPGWEVIGNAIISATGLLSPTAEDTITVVLKWRDFSDTSLVKAINVPRLWSIDIIPDSVHIDVNKTQQFTATAFDQFGDIYITVIHWKTSVGSIITNTGLFSSSTAGTYTVTAYAGAIEDSAIVIVNGPDFITEKGNEKISVYPTPFKNNLYIQSNSEIESVTIYNIIGKQVFYNKVKGNNVNLLLNGLNAGVYMVIIKNENSVITRKVIKE